MICDVQTCTGQGVVAFSRTGTLVVCIQCWQALLSGEPYQVRAIWTEDQKKIERLIAVYPER